MKGLLRTMGVVGLLTGGMLGAGCGVDGSSAGADTHKSPVQSKYQTPASLEAQPMGPERSPGASIGEELGDNPSSRGFNKGINAQRMPGHEALGRSMSEYTGAAPDQTGIGGAGQDGDLLLPPQQPQDPVEKGAQDPAQQNTTPRGE